MTTTDKKITLSGLNHYHSFILNSKIDPIQDVLDNVAGSDDIASLFSTRPAKGTIRRIAQVVQSYTTAESSAYITQHTNKKFIVSADSRNNTLSLYEEDGSRTTGNTYTDYTRSNDNGFSHPVGIAEDNDGYIYISCSSSSSSVFKFQIQETSSDENKTYSFIKVGKISSLYYNADQIEYCSKRDALIVTTATLGTLSIPRSSFTDSDVTRILQGDSGFGGGCFDKDETTFFRSIYGDEATSTLVVYDSINDTSYKNLPLLRLYPPEYTPSTRVDSRCWIAANDGYMYHTMLDGTIYKYDVQGNHIETFNAKIGSGSDSKHWGCVTYDPSDNTIVYVDSDGYACKLYL